MTTQEEKELLLEDLCGRLPYGVKILYKGWDSDHGCEFWTDEDLIGIDDRFIYTLWRGERNKHSIVEPLSIMDYKPYLRPWSSMTEKEIKEIQTLLGDAIVGTEMDTISILGTQPLFKYLNKKMIDYRGLIEKGSALEAPEGMYSI